MAEESENEQKLRHELRNAEAEKAALQSMLNHASEEIEDLVESDCEDENKDEALRAASRFRRAASL